MRRARLWSYLGWQARDFVTERGAPLLIVATLIWGSVIITLRRIGDAMPGSSQVGVTVLGLILEAFQTFSVVAVLIGINGIVSNDRVRGYYRFLFAKPVSIPRYYAQAFAVNGIGLLVTVAIVLTAVYTLGYPIFPMRVLAWVGLAYISLGGLGFLFSTLMRFDWILMGATFGLSHVLRALFPAYRSRAGEVLDVILPPFHHLHEVGEQLARGEPADPSILAWLLGWGGTAFILGLLILRRRPLAT